MPATLEDVHRMRSGLTYLYDEVGPFLRQYGGEPTAGSQADSERAALNRTIVDAWSIGALLIDYGGDHLTAFEKLITEPVPMLATWTCVRSMLESCALAAWILDPAIEAKERAGRGLSHRFNGIVEELKLGRARSLPQPEIDSLSERLDDIENEAIALGLAPIRNREGERDAVACRIPNATTMIENMLGEGNTYRLPSGVAHGHTWAIHSLNWKKSPEPDEMFGTTKVLSFEKSADPLKVLYLGMRTAKAFARPLWNQCHYCGWNALQLEEILENAFDRVGAMTEPRFWKT